MIGLSAAEAESSSSVLACCSSMSGNDPSTPPPVAEEGLRCSTLTAGLMGRFDGILLGRRTGTVSVA